MIEAADPIQGGAEFRERPAPETVHALLHRLSECAPIGADHRRAAGHRLDRHRAKWLDVDRRREQAGCARHQGCAVLRADLADEAAIAVAAVTAGTGKDQFDAVGLANLLRDAIALAVDHPPDIEGIIATLAREVVQPVLDLVRDDGVKPLAVGGAGIAVRLRTIDGVHPCVAFEDPVLREGAGIADAELDADMPRKGIGDRLVSVAADQADEVGRKQPLLQRIDYASIEALPVGMRPVGLGVVTAPHHLTALVLGDALDVLRAWRFVRSAGIEKHFMA